MTDENGGGLTDPEDSSQNISGWFQDPEDSSKQRFKLFSHGNDIIDYTAKLFQEENMCDCNLVAKGGIVIPVHKFMLVKCSFLWRILLKSSCCYGRCDHGLQTATVFLPDISFRHLSIVIKFLYSGMFDERVVGQDKEPLIAIFKLLGFPLGNVNWCQNIEGYSNCPNCDEYIHKNEMLKHLVKVHVEEPCAKDLAAYEEKKDLATPHRCTECVGRKSDKPYYVQYNMDDARESIVNHYKQEHFQHYCQFVEDNQQDREELFERDVFQKVQHVGLQMDFQSRQDWDRMLNTVPQASSTGAISPPRTRDDDSEADSCDFPGNIDSNMESSDNECVKCKKVFDDSNEYRSHTAYKCLTCGAKILWCQKKFHDKKHDSESLPRKGNKKGKRSGLVSRRLISSSSSSDEGVNRVKPGQAAKRKRNELDDSSDDENMKSVRPRRPSSSSRRPSSTSKICITKTKKSEVAKTGLFDDEGLLTHEGLLFGDRTNRVPSLSCVDNVVDILASNGSNQDDKAADSWKLHLEEMAPPNATNRPSPPNATSRPIPQDDRTKSASNHSNLENSTFSQQNRMPASSTGHLNLNNGSMLNEGGRAIFQPINTSQIEMDNAERDMSREDDGRREDDGNETDIWEDGFDSDADN